MSDDFGKNKDKFDKHNSKHKNKYHPTEDKKFENKAKKAFKNRVRELREEELMDDIDNYDEHLR